MKRRGLVVGLAVMSNLSKTQIDRLGDRLRDGPSTESDLRLLDEYRRSFGEVYEAVVTKIRQRSQSPTGRPAKSTVSIVQKLRRESIRLSQMQDIAGCRIVVENIVEQEQLVAALRADFTTASVINRRENPSHGYRAVHIIVEISRRHVEIQVRSSLQHLWAELSEKSSDVIDPTIKYGGGTDLLRTLLTQVSEGIARLELWEKNYSEAVASLREEYDAAHDQFKTMTAKLLEHHQRHLFEIRLQAMREKMERLKHEKILVEQKEPETREELARMRKVISDLMNEASSRLDDLKRQKQ